MRVLKCAQCDNTERFTIQAVEHHTWIIDEHENFIEDVECYEAKQVGEPECAKCGSQEVNWRSPTDPALVLTKVRKLIAQGKPDAHIMYDMKLSSEQWVGIVRELLK